MATKTEDASAGRQDKQLVEMAWDPITRIVGSLGIYTKIDFGQQEVAECHSTSSIFRGYSIFMKGKDPRDAHFITSRICGICGDNHATCSCYCQNMAYGVHPPALGEQIVNLGEAAEYMFDHNIFQENLVGVDFCEKMVAETNPGVLEQANRTEAPHAGEHGYKTIGDIMRSLNPFSGEFYREALQVSRYTREMFCLMEGRHVHPSTLYPGGVGTTATIQLFTDYYSRLMRYVEFMKRVVPMHDDLFDFFYEAMPGYEEVGNRRILLGCWGAFQDPDVCNFKYKDMTEWGRAMGVTPGVVVDGKLVTNDLVDINLGIRILLGSSFYESWEDQEMFVTQDPLGNPVDRNHPWNQHTIPQPQKRDFDDKYSWVMSPRWFDGTDHLALDTGGGPLARLWSTALSGSSTSAATSRPPATASQIHLPKTALKPGHASSGRSRSGRTRSSATGPAPTSRPTRPAAALHFLEKALAEVRAGKTKTWEPFEVPDEGIGCGFTEAVRGVLSHHMVIKGGKIANYHPYPPTPWNANPRDVYGTPGPYEDAVQDSPIFEENDLDHFKGIDIMRTVRSFDPCLPCGVHMYLGKGKVLKKVHSPTMLQPRRSRLSREPASMTDDPDDRRPRSSSCSTSCRHALDPRVVRPGGRAAAARHRALRRGSGAASSSSPSDTRPTLVGRARRRRAGRQPADRARSAPRRPATCASQRRSTRCARSSPATAATSSCSTSTSTSARCTCACSGAATAARRRRSRCATTVERAILEAAPEIVIIDVEEPSDSSRVSTPVALGSQAERGVRPGHGVRRAFERT